jgi:LysR family hydrogen peroxide-inducible transcriptional activator
MTFQQLQYVIALEETGNFTVAAKACHVTQPTLSAQVKKLEDEWETLLFDRSRQPIRPTPTGERVVSEARAALDRMKALGESVRQDRSDLGGTLEIGIIPTLATYFLPRVLGPVQERLPRVTFRVTEALTAEVIEKVRRGRWDLGLVSTPTGAYGLEEKPLFQEAFVAYLSPGHELLSHEKVSLKSLEDTGLLLLREGHCFRDQVLSFCGSAAAPKGLLQFESGSLDTLMRMADAGHGSTLIPEGMALDLEEERRNLVRPLAEGDPRRTLGSLALPDAPKAALVAAFLEAVKKALPSRWLRPL